VVQISMALPAAVDMIAEPLRYMGLAGILANVLLMVFNLIPLPPLDGGRVAVGLLPGPLAYRLSLVEPYGFFILIGLMLLGVLGMIVIPVAELVVQLVLLLTGF
jgi:Zn-dependent protease